MGGCATKPKVLKGEEGDVPQPGPEHPGKEETVAAEAKDVAVLDHGVKKVEGDGGGDHDVAKVKEIVEDGKADDQDNKRRSLSNLFKENEEGKDSTKADDAPSEPGKAKEESETKQPEAEKSVVPVEKTATQEFVVAPEKPLAEKATDATLAKETKTEDAKSSETETEGAKSPEKKVELAESLEKKVEEAESLEKTIEEVKAPEKKTEEVKSPEVETEDAKSSEKNIKDSESADEKIIEKLSEAPALSSAKSM